MCKSTFLLKKEGNVNMKKEKEDEKNIGMHLKPTWPRETYIQRQEEEKHLHLTEAFRYLAFLGL